MPSIRGVVNEFSICSSCSLHNPTIHESHAGRPTTWIRNKEREGEREGESESESERREWRRGDAHFGPYPPVRNWWPCIRPRLNLIKTTTTTTYIVRPIKWMEISPGIQIRCQKRLSKYPVESTLKKRVQTINFYENLKKRSWQDFIFICSSK